MSNFDLHQHITDQLITIMENGVAPWECPWIKQGNGMPMNYASGKAYSGINVLMLWLAASENNYASSYWATFKQIKAAGGNVIKGSKGHMVIYYDTYEKENDQGDKNKIPFLKYYKVFNLDQTDLVVADDKETKDAGQFQTTPAFCDVENAITNMGVNIKWTGQGACYIPNIDEIHMPDKSLFYSEQGLIATLMHEGIHATGHKTRLDRKLSSRYGSSDYAIEEVITEFATVLLQAEMGLVADLHDHASYLESWIKRAKEDKRFLFKAMSDATKAVEYFKANLSAKNELKDVA